MWFDREKLPYFGKATSKFGTISLYFRSLAGTLEDDLP